LPLRTVSLFYDGESDVNRLVGVYLRNAAEGGEAGASSLVAAAAEAEGPARKRIDGERAGMA